MLEEARRQVLTLLNEAHIPILRVREWGDGLDTEITLGNGVRIQIAAPYLGVVRQKSDGTLSYYTAVPLNRLIEIVLSEIAQK